MKAGITRVERNWTVPEVLEMTEISCDRSRANKRIKQPGSIWKRRFKFPRVHGRRNYSSRGKKRHRSSNNHSSFSRRCSILPIKMRERCDRWHLFLLSRPFYCSPCKCAVRCVRVVFHPRPSAAAGPVMRRHAHACFSRCFEKPDNFLAAAVRVLFPFSLAPSPVLFSRRVFFSGELNGDRSDFSLGQV